MPKSIANRPSLLVLRWCFALGAVGFGVSGARAQGSLDLDGGSQSSPAVIRPGEPRLIANPTQPVTWTREGIQDGVAIRPMVPLTDAPATTVPSPFAPRPVVALPPLPEPVNLDRPSVVDTALLSSAGKMVPLFGIVGQQGDPAQQMQAFLASTDGHLMCPSHTATDFVCLLSDGTDVATVALINGAARTRDDAPDAYREQEVQAQAARRGIWANLPPTPEMIAHPMVRDTATLFANGKFYVLDGLVGLGGPYAPQLQGYIAGHGDSLNCQAQGIQGHFICVLGDGTDIANVALVNGAARVDVDAADSYRLQQLDALNNRRGFWLNPPAEMVTATRRYVPATGCCGLAPGDDGVDGIAYVGGAPTAVIGGETVFLVLAGLAGWGYYDHDHHWHGAPDRYRSHLERFHPEGRGLRGYRTEAAVRTGVAGSYGGRPGGAAPYPGQPR